ncbi:MAG: serine/threonine-protein kinase [Anaerolineales bacterium]|nr:serine/threonine-protein kinase [Anaerolineales bacterium]
MTLEKDTILHHRYRIIEILGQGGMGSVYSAVDENLGATVAIKENLFTTEEYSRQFRLEAVILANLRHPNLPRVYDHFVLGDQGQYLVMDFIEGEDLRQRMERMGFITEEDAVQIGASICDALSYLHSRKPPIIHRDIKPGNVKVTPEGHIFLVDFGLAKVYQSAAQATTTGARAMTPGYSPPEQYGTARTDLRTDIYSLGATLYASLCGMIPEDGLARAMDNAQLTPLRKRNSNVSRRIAAAIEKAMSIDPSDRFQTAEEFKKALLNAKSKTQQIAGSYLISPPPASGQSSDAATQVDNPRQQTGPVPAAQEDQPFVSPLKKQKEREKKRRGNFIRFLFFLILLGVLSIAFFVPGIMPEQIRGLVFPPTATLTPSATITPSPVPTSTATATLTATATKALPTATATLTLTSAVVVVETQPSGIETASITPAPTSSPTLALTPIGGGGEVAYVSNRSGSPQIYLARISGESTTQITSLPEGACQPAWSPDGQQLIFVSPCKGMDDVYRGSSLYMINADGSNLTALPTVPGGDFEPAWSPDGTTIAFTSLRTGNLEIFLLNVEDQAVTQLTKGSFSVTSRQPAWSPDGSQIAYTVKRLGVLQIWLMNSDGSAQMQIVRSGSSFNDSSPAWSPDGQLIVFTQHCATSACLPYAMKIPAADRSVQQATPLQLASFAIENIKYSPDGFWLTYEGDETGKNTDIFYSAISGANRTRLTSDPGLDFDPSWRPPLK